MKMSQVLILDNLRSAENVGSIFRTADAAGVNFVYCAGTTPAPKDKFGRPNSKIAKAALGAEKTVGWKTVANTARLVAKLKKDGFQIIALEQNKKAVDFRKLRPKKSWALVVGNEVRGVAPAVLKLADQIIEIPMRGQKESLNVSVATGIALFQIC